MKVKFIKSVFTTIDGYPFRKAVGDVVDLKATYADYFVGAGYAESLEVVATPKKKQPKKEVEPVVVDEPVVESAVEDYAIPAE